MHTKKNTMARVAALALVALLTACAGTVKHHSRVNGDVTGVEGVGKVVARMSPAAVAQQADNPQFSRDELATYLYRKLESKGMVAAGATHQVEIVVTDIRVRSAAAAVILGVLAGEDRVVGTVRVLDSANKPLRSFEIKASYALGGWGGGQDSMRMNWMYDKFSELAMQELDKFVVLPRTASTRTQTTVLAPGAAAPALVLAPSSPNAAATTLAPPDPAAPGGARAFCAGGRAACRFDADDRRAGRRGRRAGGREGPRGLSPVAHLESAAGLRGGRRPALELRPRHQSHRSDAAARPGGARAEALPGAGPHRLHAVRGRRPRRLPEAGFHRATLAEARRGEPGGSP